MKLSQPKNLTSTILLDADLTESNLTESNLQNADLRNANFSGSNLTKANFNGANLTGANFNGAIIDETIFSTATGTNLTGAIFKRPRNLKILTSFVRTPLGKVDKMKILFTTERTKNYIIQASSNLSLWRSIETNILGNDQTLERIYDIENSAIFYRVIHN